MQNNYNKFTDMLIDLNKAVTELSYDKYLNSYQQQLDAIIVDMKEFVNLNLKDINGLTPPPYDKQEIFDRVVKQLNKGNFTDITRKDLREVISWDKTYQEQSHVSLLSKCISHPERYIDQKLCYLICCVWINYYDKLEDKRNIIKLMLNGYISFIEKTCKDKKKLFDRTITIKKKY